MVTGLPRTITVCSEEITEALKENAAVIVQAAKGVLERTPPELSADIIDRGVILTGGGALLHGIDMLLAEELKVPVLIAENPMHCVAVGTGIMLENIDRLPKRAFEIFERTKADALVLFSFLYFYFAFCENGRKIEKYEGNR